MEPRADGLIVRDRARAPGQGQERLLEGVLDVVRLAEDSAASREDHRTVTRDQGPEGVRVVRGDETFQKLSLRHCVVPKVPWIRGMVADRNGDRGEGTGDSSA